LATFGGSYDGDDMLLEIWEMDEGERVSTAEFFAPNDNRWRAEFVWSRDSNSVAVMIADADVEIFALYVVDALSGDIRLSREFYPYTDPTLARPSYDMTWGRENRLTIIVPELIGKSVTILDGVTGEDYAFLDFENLTGLSWHPDHDIFVVTTTDTIDFYNGVNGELIMAAPFSGRIDDTSWSPDGTRLALFGYDERIHLWDVEIDLGE
jgi:WD40 repeat protein